MIGEAWKSTGYYLDPTTPGDLMQALGAIGTYSGSQRFAWRGLASCDFTLTSHLHRDLASRGYPITEDAIRKSEVSLLKQAREWGLGARETDNVDDLQLLADLQHFAVPTRLIDFTSNPMTAMWFASQGTPDGVSATGLLLALNVSTMRRFDTLGDPYSSTWNEVGNPKGSRLEHALTRPAPFTVSVSHPNARLRAQEGFFVAGKHPHPLTPLDSPFISLHVPYTKTNQQELATRLTTARPQGGPPTLPFVAVLVRSNLKKKMLKYLEGTYNRSERVLFPDFPGFAKHWENL